jgi:predicted RNA binding protein YcfA (HicA-like mRNA interferase family)
LARFPRLKAKDLIRALNKAGFVVLRVKGSHHFLGHSDGRCTVVPVHGGETLGTGLLHKILRDVEISVDNLAALL